MLEGQEKKLKQYVGEYLSPVGWLKSCASGEAVDLSGPVPWYTYPMLKVLPGLIRPHFKVFEFGAGNSSLWWASGVAQIGFR